MLKCGQKNNENYTFGIKEKENNISQEQIVVCTCPHCGQTSMIKTNFCSNCGEKM